MLDQSLARAGLAPTLYLKHVPDPIKVSVARASFTKDESEDPTEAAGASDRLPIWKEFKKKSLYDLEKTYIEILLAQSSGDLLKAEELSGLKKSSLYAFLKKHNLKRSI